MPTEEIKVKITADKSGIDNAFGDMKKSADKVQAESSKAATSIGGVISAVVGAAAVSKITGFFSAAIGQYNTLNAALMRVESTSKAVGQNIERNKKLVQDLADKGFLSLTESANAFSDSISMGLNPDKAKKFVESLSDIAAVERTMGTLNEAVSSGISGLRSGSSERVENIGVSVKKLSQEYQINSQKVGQAAAMEKFYQGVIKESVKYQGEAIKTVETLAGAQTKYTAAVDKAQAAIGKGLAPVMKSLYQIGASIFSAFETWFSGLESGAQTILVMIPLVASLILAVASLGKGMVAVGIISASTWAAILGPLTLVIGLVAVLGFAVKELYETFRKGKGEKLVDEKKSLEAQIAALEKAGKKTQELTDAKEKLTITNANLVAQYGKYLKALGLENASLETKLSLYKRIDEAEKRLGGKESISARSDDEIKGRIKHSEDELAKGRALLAAGTIGKDRFDEVTKEYTDEIFYLKKELEGRKAATPAAVTSVGNKGVETRFIETQKKLAEIEKNRLFTIAKIDSDKGLSESERKTRIQNAYDDSRQLAAAEIGQLRSVYAEFIEDKYMAEKLALDKQTDDAIRAVREQESAGEIIKEQAENRIQKIREANAKKQAQLAVDSFAATANAAAGIAKGITQARNGDIMGGSGSALSGAAGFGKGLEGMGLLKAGGAASKFLGSLGMAGTVVSAVGGVVSAIGDLFGKSDADRAREAAELQRRQEEQLKILELQANYQKDMLALQEAQAKLPFENLTRNMRLIDIQAQQKILGGADESIVREETLTAKKNAVQNVLSEQSGTIAKNQLFGDVVATPDGLIDFLNKRAEQSLAVSQFNALIQSTSDPNMSFGRMEAILGIAKNYQGLIPDQLYNTGISGLNRVYAYIHPKSETDRADTRRWNESDMQFRTRQANVFAEVTSSLANARSGSSALLSEISSDTGVAENLLTVIEQGLSIQQEIEKSTKKTAENTTKLADGKGDAIIDIAAGGISQNGAFVQGGLLKYLMGKTQIDTSAMMLNPSIQNAILSTQVMDSVDERMAKGMDRLVQLNEQEVELLAIIAENLSEKNTELAQDLKQKVLDILAEFRSRS